MSLSLRISLIIGFIAIAMSSIVAFINYHIQLEKTALQSKAVVMQMAQNDKGTSSIAAYLLDSKLASEIVEGLANNDLIAFAKLSAHNEDLSTSGKTTNRKAWLSVNLSDPFDETINIGTLTLEPDSAFIQKQASDIGLQTGVVLIGLSAVIALLVGIFVNSKLTHPLRVLSREFKYFDTSNPESMCSIDINYAKHDEISKLIQTINQLIAALQNRFKSEKVLRQTTEELQKRFRLLFEQATAGIALISAEGEVTIANPAFKELFSQASITHNFASLFDEPEKVNKQLKLLRKSNGITQIDIDFACRKGRHKRYLHCLFSTILDSREVTRDDSHSVIEVIVYDVTKRREKELTARYEADHDSLTGLMNRRSGLINLQLQFNKAIEERQLFSLMMIDLDKFKPINDTYGHDAGDVVLQTISSRVANLVDDKQATLIRWGGDEFLLGLTIEGQNSITEFAETLLRLIQQEIQLNLEISVAVGASIGIIRTLQNQPQNVDDLIIKADELMYHIKDSGRNTFRISTLI